MLDNIMFCPDFDCGGNLKLFTNSDYFPPSITEAVLFLKCDKCEVMFQASVHATSFELVGDDVSKKIGSESASIKGGYHGQ